MQARMKNPAIILPDALKALHALNKTTHRDGVPYVTRALVHLRASQINGCSVCVGMHAQELKKAGESDERIFAVAAWRDTPYFTEASAPRSRSPRRSPASPTGQTRCPTRLGDAARHYGEADLAALILSIAQINVWNRLNTSVRQVAGAAWN